MSTTTDKLALFKYDPSTDGAQTFNIKQALNDNWDKLDDAVKAILITLANKAPATHADRHAKGGSDSVTPESIGAASTDELNAIPKPNLFINPLFQVWQLYPSGWSGVPVNRYVCDGWVFLSSNGSKPNNFTPAYPCGIVSEAGGASCTVAQFLVDAARYNGLQMTCSVLKIRSDGSQSFVSATKTASGWTDTTDILAFFGTSNQWRWINPGETFVGAKLEVGTRQTFVYKQADGTYTLNNIPPVAEQLAICNKYDPGTGKLFWGWVNPPMYLGTEYRTTERYLGKPVYVKTINMGNLPGNAVKRASFQSNNVVDKIVSVTGQCTSDSGVNISMPYHAGSGPNWNSVILIGADGAGATQIVTFDPDFSGYKDACITVKYTKLAD